MRVLVLADIHANWAALSAIQETFDLCLCVGDLVDYGPQPGPCVEWVQKNCAHVVRGNHDHALVQDIIGRGDVGYRHLAAVTRSRTRARLLPGGFEFLRRLPVTKYLRIVDKTFFLVHATPRDPLDEYLYNDEGAWARRLENVDADCICVGHTHYPFVMRVGNKIVLNPGSVGQPRDGDPRASYAVIEDGHIQIRRVEYPVEQTIAAFEELHLPESCVQFATQVLRTGGNTPGNGKMIHAEIETEMSLY